MDKVVKTTAYNNLTSIYRSRKYDEDALPFDTKPRIARTPVHSRQRSSSDLTITADSPRETFEANIHAARGKHVTSQKTENKENEASVKKRKDMEVVGHAFDSPEKKTNQNMQSTLGSTSGIGSSLEESGELSLARAGIERLVIDGKEDATLVEDVDDYELDYEDDTDSEEDHSDRRLKDGKLIKQYEEHVDRMDQDDTYSDTMDEGSDGESLEDSEGYEESDEDEEGKGSVVI